jgi:hypothetical protein
VCRNEVLALLTGSDFGKAFFEISIASPYQGTCATPNTPEPVKYFLEQAARSFQASALSAAAAMYRVVIDQVMLQQGFKKGMLGAKLDALQKALSDGTAPTPCKGLSPKLLTALKDISDATLHASEEEFAAVKAMDEEVIRNIEAVVAGLLDTVYEEPKRKTDLADSIDAAAAGISKKRKLPATTP